MKINSLFFILYFISPQSTIRKIESNSSKIESNYRKLTLDSIFVESRVSPLNTNLN